MALLIFIKSAECMLHSFTPTPFHNPDTRLLRSLDNLDDYAGALAERFATCDRLCLTSLISIFALESLHIELRQSVQA